MVCKRRRIDDFFEKPTTEILKNIQNQLGENDDRLVHCEKLLKKWLNQSSHLPKNCDVDFMRNFLRGTKFNLDGAKRKLEAYFLGKLANPELYTKRDPAHLTSTFAAVNIVALPKLTENGERIWVMSLNSNKAEELDLVMAVRLFLMLFDWILTCEFPVASEIFIFDATHFGPAHLVKFLSPIFQKAVTILRDCYAVRLSHVHVINCPIIVDKLVGAVRPLLPDKIKKRLIVHKGADSLLLHLPSRLLPSDIGGNLNSSRYFMQKWQQCINDNADWFRQQETVQIMGTPPKQNDSFAHDISLQGSFRQLNID